MNKWSGVFFKLWRNIFFAHSDLNNSYDDLQFVDYPLIVFDVYWMFN